MRKAIPFFIKILSFLAPPLAVQIAFRLFATPIRIARPESEMYAYNTAKKYFLKNGIAAFEWGEKNSPLVMLVHGWNGRGTQIAFCAHKLVEKGYRVVALDGPGHGISPGKMTNPNDYAQFIVDAQKELAPLGAHAVIAHSFGGGCAVFATTKGLMVNGLVLVASPARYKKVVDDYIKMIGLKFFAKNLFYKKVIEVAKIKPEDFDLPVIAKNNNLTLMVVHDRNDDAVPFESAEYFKSHYPDCALLTTKGLGHRRVLKDSYVISEMVDFITKIS